MRKRRRWSSVHPDLSNASDEELDRERYETDLWKSFIEDYIPREQPYRAQALRETAQRYPERWVAFAANWPKQVAQDLQSESQPSDCRKGAGRFFYV